MNRDEILTKVQKLLADALGVDEEEVTPTASLRADLGAESIDFLDIQFRLEKVFGVKIPKGDLFPESLDPQFVQDNKLTDAGFAEVKRRLAHSDLSKLESTRDTSLIPDLFTVNDIVDYLDRKVHSAASAS